jgi:hypothetical protein
MVIIWTLVMQDYGLSISLQKLNMKVIELTQTRVTPFRNGILGNS